MCLNWNQDNLRDILFENETKHVLLINSIFIFHKLCYRSLLIIIFINQFKTLSLSLFHHSSPCYCWWFITKYKTNLSLFLFCFHFCKNHIIKIWILFSKTANLLKIKLINSRRPLKIKRNLPIEHMNSASLLIHYKQRNIWKNYLQKIKVIISKNKFNKITQWAALIWAKWCQILSFYRSITLRYVPWG